MDKELVQLFTTCRSQKTANGFRESSFPRQAGVAVTLRGRACLEFRRTCQICFWLVSKITASFFQLCAKIFIPALAARLHEELSTHLNASSSQFHNQWIIPSILAGEDHRFYFHKGADPVGIIRASVLTVMGRVQGGSTIEQQLVRTVTGDYRRSIVRKYKELMLASTLVSNYSKREILKIYLDVAYFGPGIIGMQAAERILLAQCQESDSQLAAILIAHLKFPSQIAASSDRFSHRRELRILHILSRVKLLHYWFNDRSEVLS